MEIFEENLHSQEKNDSLTNDKIFENNQHNSGAYSNNTPLTNFERKSTNSYLNEKNHYKRQLEDSYIKIESYKRIIISKDEHSTGQQQLGPQFNHSNNAQKSLVSFNKIVG